MSDIKVCKECGEQLDENAKFCKYCGAPVDGPEDINTSEIDKPVPVNASEKTKRSSRRNVLLVIVIIACIALAGGIGFYIGGHINEQSNSSSDSEEESQGKANISDEDAASNDEKYSDPEQSDPRAFVCYIYSQIVAGRLTGEEYWDRYVSEETNTRVVKSEYVNWFDNSQEYNKVIGYLSQYYNDSETGKYTVTGMLQILSSSGDFSEMTTVTQVVVENGKYKIEISF